MDSLKDLLLAKDLDQPSEMKATQEFLLRELKFPFSIKDYPKHITISVGNGKVGYLLRISSTISISSPMPPNTAVNETTG
jgi:hypothetical protein